MSIDAINVAAQREPTVAPLKLDPAFSLLARANAVLLDDPATPHSVALMSLSAALVDAVGSRRVSGAGTASHALIHAALPLPAVNDHLRGVSSWSFNNAVQAALKQARDVVHEGDAHEAFVVLRVARPTARQLTEGAVDV